ncbi:hypothetical protein MTR67_007564 [Solanum verrucosum]|uniref:Uncharacterized protein n=1 Tax=Solanum verrucosum TaxID=315347 RepID=A0AAF0Q6C8_SOLVR|nr:hypothetical protein MTR67_007564 [Solanum verrucosum]
MQLRYLLKPIILILVLNVLYTVSICLNVTDLGVWNSRISFTFMAQMGYTVNVEALQLQGCSVRLCLIAYSNSMTRVWDPRQSRCVNSSILQSDLARAVALSPNFTPCYIVERGTVLSNASLLLVEIDYSFVVVLWLRTIPCWHDSPEEYFGGSQNKLTLYLDFHLCKGNWVNTGQECTLSEFLLPDICAYKTFDVLNFSLGGVTWLASIMWPYIGGCDQLNFSQFPFDPGTKCVTVSICLIATDLGVWNSRISFIFMAYTGYTVNVEALQLQGCYVRFCLIAYSNSMTRVWDPGQSWCVNSSILQSDLALAVALSPNFTPYYIVEKVFPST